MGKSAAVLGAVCLALAWENRIQAEPAGTLFDMDTLQHAVGEFTDNDNHKQPAGTVESVAGKFGQAVKFTFKAGARGGFMTGRAQPTPDWDQADGFSFWVQGDGSQTWGGIELIDRDDFGRRYGYCFPIDSTAWRKIVVRWGDLTPELAGPLVDAQTGQAPSRLSNFWFGKWFYWRDFPAQSYMIDQVQLEPKIEAALPVEKAPRPNALVPGLARLREKLSAHRPVTIVTMGDSLTDERHWANKPVVWARLLAQSLREKYASEVKLVNPAIGGTTLSQNLVLAPRWSLDAPQPDLIVVWFGGNDWDSGVRGPRFAEYLRLAVDRLRRQTQGSADILLLTTCPAFARWETYRELEQAVLDVAEEKQTGAIDIAALFRAAGTPDAALKQQYWASDKVHLGAKGHETVRDAILAELERQETKRSTPSDER